MSEFHQFDHLGDDPGDVSSWLAVIAFIGVMDLFAWAITQNPVVIGVTTVGGLIVGSMFSEN